MLHSIENDSPWRWGNTGDIYGKAKNLLQALEHACGQLPEASRSFMCGCNVADLIQDFGQEHVQEEFGALGAHLSKHVSQLADHLTRVSSMHSIMNGRKS